MTESSPPPSFPPAPRNVSPAYTLRCNNSYISQQQKEFMLWKHMAALATAKNSMSHSYQRTFCYHIARSRLLKSSGLRKTRNLIPASAIVDRYDQARTRASVHLCLATNGQTRARAKLRTPLIQAPRDGHKRDRDKPECTGCPADSQILVHCESQQGQIFQSEEATYFE